MFFIRVFLYAPFAQLSLTAERRTDTGKSVHPTLCASIIFLCCVIFVRASDDPPREKAILLQDTVFSADASAGGQFIQVGANTEVIVLERSEFHMVLDHQGAKARVEPSRAQLIAVRDTGANAIEKESLFAEARQRRQALEEEQESLWGLEARALSGEVLSVLPDGILLTLDNSEFRILKVITRKDAVDGDKFKAMAAPLDTTFTYEAANGGAKTVRVWKDLEAP